MNKNMSTNKIIELYLGLSCYIRNCTDCYEMLGEYKCPAKKDENAEEIRNLDEIIIKALMEGKLSGKEITEEEFLSLLTL